MRGGYDVTTEEAFYAVTADRSHRFDDLCVAAGRDPASIRHSLVCFPPLTPWQSVDYFEDVIVQASLESEAFRIAALIPARAAAGTKGGRAALRPIPSGVSADTPAGND